MSGKDDMNIPQKSLDAIYIAVLQQSVPENYSQREKDETIALLKEILGPIAVLVSQFSSHSLSKFLEIPENEIHEALEELHAIIQVPNDPGHPIRLHHTSFRDFLLNKSRCGESFWIEEPSTHLKLVSSCITAMKKSLERDMCHLTSSSYLAKDIEPSRVDQHLVPEVQYACLYWVQHLQKSNVQLSDDDNDKVHTFLRDHFLHWLEALSLMGKMREGIHAINLLEFIALVSRVGKHTSQYY